MIIKNQTLIAWFLSSYIFSGALTPINFRASANVILTSCIKEIGTFVCSTSVVANTCSALEQLCSAEESSNTYLVILCGIRLSAASAMTCGNSPNTLHQSISLSEVSNDTLYSSFKLY